MKPAPERSRFGPLFREQLAATWTRPTQGSRRWVFILVLVVAALVGGRIGRPLVSAVVIVVVGAALFTALAALDAYRRWRRAQ